MRRPFLWSVMLSNLAPFHLNVADAGAGYLFIPVFSAESRSKAPLVYPPLMAPQRSVLAPRSRNKSFETA